jgi:polyhydroxyalkanoate synthesis regulator phasin
MSDQQKQRGGLGGIGDGLRTGIGILNAFKEAIEETLQEAVERGDLSPDRAKRAMRDAAQRVQEVFDETRDRVDFVPRAELDSLRAEIAALRERVARLEERGGGATAGDSGIIVTE